MKKLTVFNVILALIVGSFLGYLINLGIQSYKDWQSFNDYVSYSVGSQTDLTKKIVWVDLDCWQEGREKTVRTFYVPQNMTPANWKSKIQNNSGPFPLADLWGYQVPDGCKMVLRDGNGEEIGTRYNAVNNNGNRVPIFSIISKP